MQELPKNRFVLPPGNPVEALTGWACLEAQPINAG